MLSVWTEFGSAAYERTSRFSPMGNLSSDHLRISLAWCETGCYVFVPLINSSANDIAWSLCLISFQLVLSDGCNNFE
uniref:Uncharacterized protein n=1 Tax=Anopheles funestus TaxID=62324 RepID=A0A182S4F3_ANOFN